MWGLWWAQAGARKTESTRKLQQCARLDASHRVSVGPHLDNLFADAVGTGKYDDKARRPTEQKDARTMLWRELADRLEAMSCCSLG